MLRHLQRELSAKNGTLWLKSLENEILSENPGMKYKCCARLISAQVRLFRDLGVSRPLRAMADTADRILISRLEMDPDAMM
jgi:hypothetical protein